MKLINFLSIFCLIALALALFAGCTPEKTTDGAPQSSQKETTTGSPAQDVTAAMLAEAVEEKITLDASLSLIEKGELSLMLGEHISDAVDASDDYVIKFTGGASFDEFGILGYADEKSAEAAAQNIRDYLKSLQEDALYRSYFPEEEYKLDQSQVRIYGKYVAYAVLSDSNMNAFFGQIEGIL